MNICISFSFSLALTVKARNIIIISKLRTTMNVGQPSLDKVCQISYAADNLFQG